MFVDFLISGFELTIFDVIYLIRYSPMRRIRLLMVSNESNISQLSVAIVVHNCPRECRISTFINIIEY